MHSSDAAMSKLGAAVAGVLGGVGRGAFRLLGDVGRLSMFCLATLGRLFRRRFRALELVAQLDAVGARSTGVVALSAVFTGLVLTIEGYHVLVRFGSENLVGSLVALSLTRELAPVLTALMVTARAGSAMAATIGNMAVTEQIDALEALAVDPLHCLVLPRLLASVVSLPLLTALFSLAGIGAAYLFATGVLGLDGNAFVSNVNIAAVFDAMLSDQPLTASLVEESAVVLVKHEFNSYRAYTTDVSHLAELAQHHSWPEPAAGFVN